MAVDPSMLTAMMAGGGPASAAPPGGGPMDPSQGDPTQPPAGPMPYQGSPEEQAVWAAYPSTDPQTVEQIFSPAQGNPAAIADAFQQWSHLHDQDQEKLNQGGFAVIQHVLAMLSQPSTPPVGVGGPGVGGDNVGA